MPDPLDPTDAEAMEILFGKQDIPETLPDPPQEEVKTEEVEEKPDPLEDLRKELASVKEDQHKTSMNTMATMSNLLDKMQSQQVYAEPKVKAKPSPADNPEVWNYVKTAPEIIPDLMEGKIEEQVAAKLKTFERDLDAKMQRRDVSSMLSREVLGALGNEISNPNSKIIQKAASIKEMLASVLNKELVGTDVHDKIAIGLAAGMSPIEISRIQVSRAAAEEESRNAALTRLTNLTSAGSGHTRRQVNSEITDTDKELAKKWDVDLDDEQERAEYLEEKKKTSLQAYGEIVVEPLQ